MERSEILILFSKGMARFQQNTKTSPSEKKLILQLLILVR